MLRLGLMCVEIEAQFAETEKEPNNHFIWKDHYFLNTDTKSEDNAVLHLI